MAGREHPTQAPAGRQRSADTEAPTRVPAAEAELPRRRFQRDPPKTPARDVLPTTPPVDVEPLAARRSTFRRFLLAADLGAVAAVLLVASAFGLRPSAGVILLLAAVSVFLEALGLYTRDELVLRKTTLEEAPNIAVVAALTVLVAWLLEGVVFVGPLHHAAAVALWAALVIALLAARTATRKLGQRRLAPERLLVLGDVRIYERLARALSGKSGAEVVTYVAPERVVVTGPDGSPQVSLRALDGLIQRFGVHRLVVSGQDAPSGTTLELFRAAKGLNVRLSFVPAVLATVGPRVAFDDVWGIPLIGIRRFGLTRTQRLAKRAFDLVGATVLLLAVSPVFALLCLAIRRDSPGPIFFRQLRVGRDGALFSIYKFRTMVADAEAQKARLRERNEAAGGLFKIADDPRITRVGRLLRRTSLDELPQLINVVKGGMSLVGPRPLVVDEDEQIVGWDRRRLHLTPGMTGHWQILGSARVPLDEMVRIDYRYVASWTLWEDAKILLRTVPYMLARRGM